MGHGSCKVQQAKDDCSAQAVIYYVQNFLSASLTPSTDVSFTSDMCSQTYKYSPSHTNDISSREAMNIDDRRNPAANTSSVSPQEVTSSITLEAVIDSHLALLI
ncbi:hypothetical protein PSHT_05811 [Puccinia striiformis]|uniref:Uncharacterized protein n=1 Tax=Puccinia striiformis TaxID=27350 RepID=A0A2S4W9J7_9BASI|nr:hypothetical protein PSHT_05811 [Puccinia striiformis]